MPFDQPLMATCGCANASFFLSRFFGVRHCETADRRQLMMGQPDGLAPLPTAISRIHIPFAHHFQLRSFLTNCLLESLLLCPLWLFHTSAKSTVSFRCWRRLLALVWLHQQIPLHSSGHCSEPKPRGFACYNVHLSMGCYFGWQSPLLHSGQPSTCLIELLIVPWRSRASVRLFGSSALILSLLLASFRVLFAECR